MLKKDILSTYNLLTGGKLRSETKWDIHHQSGVKSFAVRRANKPWIG
jgi:hypothetical protein